jgi:hypothetical protein
MTHLLKLYGDGTQRFIAVVGLNLFVCEDILLRSLAVK